MLEPHQEESAPCARCGRLISADGLTLWTVSERFRAFSQAERRFEYVRRPRYYAVCARCHAELGRGAAMVDVHNRRAVLVLLSVAALAAGVAALTPFALPSLMSAFWQTG